MIFRSMYWVTWGWLCSLALISSCAEDEKPKEKVKLEEERTAQRGFALAAEKNQVPVSVLLAVAKHESGFETDTNSGLVGKKVARRGFGLMNLTLAMDERAKELSEDESIGVYAFLMSEEAKRTNPKTIDDWVNVAGRVSFKEDKFLRQLFVDQCTLIMRSGFEVLTSSGQRISLAEVKFDKQVNFDIDGDGISSLVDQRCRVIGVPCSFEPAGEKNYIPGTESIRTTAEVNKIVLQPCESNFTDCIAWFKNSTSDMSSHFVVSAQGTVVQMVDLLNTAKDMEDPEHSAGTISIFVEGRTAIYKNGKAVTEYPNWISNESYVVLAELITYLSHDFDITIDKNAEKRQALVGANEILGDNGTHKGLGSFMDWEYLLRLIEVKKRELPGLLTINSPLKDQVVAQPMVINMTFSKDVQFIDVYFDHSQNGGWYRFLTLETLNESERNFAWTLRREGVGKSKMRWMLAKGYNAKGKLIARQQTQFMVN